MKNKLGAIVKQKEKPNLEKSFKEAYEAYITFDDDSELRKLYRSLNNYEY